MLDPLHRLGFDLDVPRSESSKAPHGALGYVILREWLATQRSGPASIRARIALSVVVGAHHGVLPDTHTMKALQDRPDYLGGPLWREAQNEILQRMAVRTGAAERLADWLATPLSATAQAALAATVVVADWLASDETRFPYLDRITEGARWGDLRLPTPWRPGPPPRDAAELLAQRFPALAGFSPTPIQHAAVEAAWTAVRPPLIVLEAEMGSGKTEAGLAAAEVLAHRFGQGGVFVALPTMATSDAMFGRVRDWIDQLPGPGSLSMFLAHGKAGLNDAYRGLVDDQRCVGIYDEEPGPREEGERAVATVNSWTRGRRKGVLAPFVVGTIDQVLFGALRSKHLALRHVALAGKVVVIDEVHAADTYMREYLTSILTWMGAYGTPVILMSATLPSGQREQLVAAYAAGAARTHGQLPRPSEAPETLEPHGYPRTMMLDSAVREVPTEQVAGRPRAVHLEEHPDELDHLVTLLRAELIDGGCVAIVRSTVTRAQEAWVALRGAFSDTEVVLVHSRFLAVDRARRESELRDRLGRSGRRSEGTRPNRLIVVGTQVLEQSLDIDVDLMVSDVAPVDLVLQRMGRLHRHQRELEDRPPRLREPRLILVGADWATTPPEADRGSRRVYGDALLLRSVASLRAHGSLIQLPEDIPRLVDHAYDPDLPAPVGWEERWARAEAQFLSRAEEARSRANDFRLEAPFTHEGLLARSGFFRKGDPDDGNGGRNQVRDSDDSLEVVVVRRVDGAIRAMPGAALASDTVLATDQPPEPRIARALAGCTIRLPAWSTVRDPDALIRALESTSFVGWQQDCPWLAGQLTLVLDEHGHAQVADLDLAYDDERGLVVRMRPASRQW
ncbi:CRISPR-associated helicase Cas3 [Kineosphaera limosa]|nr:CRISPR-associated helicase Cas3 [Kineosphaera limosa]